MGWLRKGINIYFKLVWPDLFCLASISIPLAVVVLAPMHLEPYHGSYRVVPMWTTENGSTFRGPTELSYPYFEPVIPSWVCGLAAIGFPIFCCSPLSGQTSELVGLPKSRDWKPQSSGICVWSIKSGLPVPKRLTVIEIQYVHTNSS